MRCIICRRTIGKSARRTYGYVPNGKGGTRKVHACARCDAKFDRWLDAQNDPQVSDPMPAARVRADQ